MLSHHMLLPPGFDFAAAQADRDAKTHVYFVEGAGLVKIGFATSPIGRFYSMLTCSPVPLSLLASMPGGPPAENRIHIKFASDRVHGEWFRRSEALDAVIAAAPHQYGPELQNRLAAQRHDRGPRSKRVGKYPARVGRRDYPARYDGL